MAVRRLRRVRDLLPVWGGVRREWAQRLSCGSGCTAVPPQGQVNSSLRGCIVGNRGCGVGNDLFGSLGSASGWMAMLAFELSWAFALRSLCLSLVFSLTRTPQRNLAVTGLQVKRDLTKQPH